MSALQSLLEKLQLSDDKNLLIQGLPSSIEKQFVKLSYSKNVTPLLKSRKIDFALVFAVNVNQLAGIMKDVVPALHTSSKLWVACPKPTSKIVSDLNRDTSWNCITGCGYETEECIDLDHVWTAKRFIRIKETNLVALSAIKAEKPEPKVAVFEKNLVVPPVELEKIFTKHKKAKELFANLPQTHQKEYVQWISEAKKEETRLKRSEAAVEKLMAGKLNPSEK
jgi:hypothetical protein